MADHWAGAKNKFAGDIGDGNEVSDDHNCDYEALKSRVGTLLPWQEEELRNYLNERHRQRSLSAVASGFSQNSSQIWRTFIERLQSGNIDEDIKGLSQSTLNEIFNQMGSMVGKVTSPPGGVESCESEKPLEEICENYQANLVSVRQAVACAIATEKEWQRLLEGQQKLLAAWEQREEGFRRQGDVEEATQAKLKQLELQRLVLDLQEKLERQKDSVCQARLLLADCEQFSRQSEVRLRSLMSREQIVGTMSRVLETLKAVDKESVLSAMAIREAEVKAKEEALAMPRPESESSENSASNFPEGSDGLLLATVLALEKANLLMAKLEKFLGHGDAEDEDDGHEPENLK